MKIIKRGLSMFCLGVLSCSIVLTGIVSPVQAASNSQEIQPRAIEQYTHSVHVDCSNKSWGYVMVYVTFSHNMTTGQTSISSVKGEPHFSWQWPLLQFHTVTTDPAVGSSFTGVRSIKVTVRCYNPAGAVYANSYGYVTS